MRALINALTTRGKTFLAVGCAAVVCGFALDEADLLRIGVLLMMLPLLSALVATRARYRLSCTRPGPAAPGAGRAAGRGAHPAVERLPAPHRAAARRGPRPALRGRRRPRFVLGAIEASGSRDLTHQVQMDQRGKYTIGPLQIRVADVVRPGVDRPVVRDQEHAGGHAGRSCRCPGSRSPAAGSATAKAACARSRRRARTTSPRAPTGTATSCAGCTGGPPRGTAS